MANDFGKRNLTEASLFWTENPVVKTADTLSKKGHY